MKAPALREQTDEELLQTLSETKQRLFDLRVKKSMGDASEQPLLIRHVRRDVARVKTVIKERGSKDDK